MKIPPDLSICIIAGNNCTAVDSTISTAMATADPVSTEIIVMDNTGRTDNNALTQKYPGVLFFENQPPESLVGLYNRCLSMAKGRYISIWKAGIRFRDCCLLQLITYLDENPATGIAAPNLDVADKQPVRLPSIVYFLAKFSGFHSLFPSNPFFKKMTRPLNVTFSAREVAWLPLSAVVINRQTIEEIGTFDDHFHLFYHDADFCRRARAAGWHIALVNEAEIKGWAATGQHILDPLPVAVGPHQSAFLQLLDALTFIRSSMT